MSFYNEYYSYLLNQLIIIVLEWMISEGWCVDTNGNEAGRNPNQGGYTKHDCFAQCDNTPILTGCTYYEADNRCNTYTGSIVTGNNDASYECYHRSGKKQVIFNWSYLNHKC